MGRFDRFQAEEGSRSSIAGWRSGFRGLSIRRWGFILGSRLSVDKMIDGLIALEVRRRAFDRFWAVFMLCVLEGAAVTIG